MMCAGVQNVSLPTDMCHEISHGPPIIPHSTPAPMHQIVHGTDSTRAPTPVPVRAAIGGLAICCPNGIDCPIAHHSSAATARGISTVLPRVYTARPFLQTAFGHGSLSIRSSVLVADNGFIADNFRTNRLRNCTQANRYACSQSLEFSPQAPPLKYLEHSRRFFVLNTEG